MENSTLDFNKLVKFTNPISEFEKTATYVVKNYNEVTQRVYIEHVCDLPIKPQQLVSVNDIENINYGV